MIPLTFTTTAMPRPEILDQTYSSFRARLTSCDFSHSTLFLNVDPFPNDLADNLRVMCAKVAQRHFGTVHVNSPAVPNFARALKWLWDTVDSEVVVHLEDDWELLEDVDVSLLLDMDREHVVLRAWTWSNYPFCLGPGLIRRGLFKFCAGALTGTTNPEVALRAALADTGYAAAVVPAEPHRVVLRDLGREWMRGSAYVRGAGSFVKWAEKTPENAAADERLADQHRELG